MAERPEVELELARSGVALLCVRLPAALDARAGRAVHDALGVKLAELEERPFALLIDTRPVAEAEPEGLEWLKRLERAAAQSGRLVRLSHLVTSAEQARATAAALEAAGVPELFRDFTDEVEARRYLLGSG